MKWFNIHPAINGKWKLDLFLGLHLKVTTTMDDYVVRIVIQIKSMY